MKKNENLSDEKQEKILQLHMSTWLQEKIDHAEHTLNFWWLTTLASNPFSTPITCI